MADVPDHPGLLNAAQRGETKPVKVQTILKVAFSLRMALLIASFGAVLGAGVIFWLGFFKLLHSIQEAFAPETNTKAIAAGVMGATDAFLFGVVLIIFASTITFGFALDVPEWLATRSGVDAGEGHWRAETDVGSNHLDLLDCGLCNRHRRKRYAIVLAGSCEASGRPPDCWIVMAVRRHAPTRRELRQRGARIGWLVLRS